VIAVRQPARPSDGPGPGGGSAHALRVLAVSKSFGPTVALRSCTLDLSWGEVHAIVGENGCGKSTLVKVLSGVHSADDGKLEVGGREVARLDSPRAALRAGIATVFQEVLVVENRSVVENVWLGSEGLFRAGVAPAEKRERVSATLAALLTDPPPLDAIAGGLSLSDRQACVIARALVRDPQVLILDEATSALDAATRDNLFALLRRRTEAGGSVIFISHRMDEIEEIGDRLSVMRSGEMVGTFPRGELSSDAMVRLMTDADQLTEHVAAAARRPLEEGPIVLRTRDLRLAPLRPPIEVELRAGELVGLAGLEGQGQDRFLQALWGGPVAGGEVLAGEEEITDRHVAADAGIAFVPRERRRQALFESKSILENFALPTLGEDTRAGLLSRRRSRQRFADYVESLRIKFADSDDLITTLSGGTQQKVVLARWLATEPRVLLLNDPTRGVDLRTKREFYRLLEGLVEHGMCLVMLSTEVDEQVELMDRVLVFRDQELSAELRRERLSRHSLVSAFFGLEGGPDAEG
jgi:ABC-type sugar transport system ATPase subunit